MSRTAPLGPTTLDGMAQLERHAVELILEDAKHMSGVPREGTDHHALVSPVVYGGAQDFSGHVASDLTAAQILGVGQSLVEKLLRDGELLGGRGPNEVDLHDLLDVAGRVRSCGSRTPLVDTLRDRVTDRDREAAGAAGVEPARLAAWQRSGMVRFDDRGRLTEAERRWLTGNGALIRDVDVLTRHNKAIDMVVLFGSRARGAQRPDSDVDLLVDGDISGNARALAIMRGELLERLRRDVEICTLPEAYASPVVLLEATYDGRVLKDTAGRWKRTVEARPRVFRQAAAERATYPNRERIALAALGVSQ